MMKRSLFCLSLLAIGAMPAHAEPRHPRTDLRGMGYRGGESEGRPDFGGRQPYRYGPGYEGRRPMDGRQMDGRAMDQRRMDDRAAEMGDYDRPMRRRADQDRARDQMRAGAIRPLRDIQQQWRQGMPGYDFLGSDYDPGAGSYRLKFLRDGSVLWIDVDGRTGREIGRRGR